MKLKNTLLTLFVFVCLTSFGQKYQYMIDQGTYTIESIETEANDYFEKNGTGQGSGYKQFQRWLYVAKRDMDENGFKRSNNSQMVAVRTYRQAQKIKRANKRKGKVDQTLGTSLTGNWEEVGPTYWSTTSGWNSGVGRITSIGVDPNNANHIIVGSPTGGVWKSTDAGINWAPLTDDFQTMDVWSLAISPHNPDHYLWGETGEVYKSVDAGATWTSTNHPSYSYINRIAYHPTDPNIVLASSTGGGVSRSTDGGSTWSAVATVTASCYDIEFKPGEPNTVYVSGSDVYKSTDAGATFLGVNGGFGTGKKMMAVTADNSAALFIVEEDGGAFGGLYKSSNSGTSFSQIRDNTLNYFGYTDDGSDTKGQAPRDMDIIVSPSNENEIHIAGIQTWKSTNGGTSFFLTSYWTHNGAASRGVGYCHADVDIMFYQGSRIYVGTDGGFYTSDNQAATFDDKTTGMGLRQYYRIGVSKTDPNMVTGGAQDNGTCVTHGASREFKFWLGADGMESFVDWNNTNNLYGTTQNGSLYKSTNQGNSYSGITEPDPDVSGAWVTPFEQDPINASTIYAGIKEVWKSTNQGSTWSQISTFGGGTLDEMKIAETNNQYIYVADGATLSRTTNGGSSWTTLSGTTGSVNWISVDPEDEQRVAVVTSSKVYVSTNAGSTWTDYTKNLPVGASYYCAVWKKGTENGLYVGGNGFISYIDDNMSNYVDFLTGLPNVKVYELEIQNVSEKIFAGTYGRGLWESDLYGSSGKSYDAGVVAISNMSSSLCGSSADPSLEIVNNGDSTLTSVDIKMYVDGALVKTVNHSTNLTTGQSEIVVVSGVSFSTEGSVILKAEVSNPNGQADENNVNDNESMAVVVAYGAPYNTQNVGPVDKTFGEGANYNNDNGLLFDVSKPMVLESVKVYAQGAGSRTVEVQNSAGSVLFSKTVSIPDGESRVQLDFSLSVGTNYRIGVSSVVRDLYRNSNGPSYPYNISNLVSIVSSTAAGVELDYYYFFYDWEVREEGCSILTSVEEVGNNVRIYPNPVKGELNFVMSDANGNESVNVQVYNAVGGLVQSKNVVLNQKQGKVNLAGLPVGNYLLQLQSDAKLSITKFTISN